MLPVAGEKPFRLLQLDSKMLVHAQALAAPSGNLPGHRARAFPRPEAFNRVQLQITCKFILKAKVENFLSTVRKTANVD